jgi:hypothetical protein
VVPTAAAVAVVSAGAAFFAGSGAATAAGSAATGAASSLLAEQAVKTRPLISNGNMIFFTNSPLQIMKTNL